MTTLKTELTIARNCVHSLTKPLLKPQEKVPAPRIVSKQCTGATHCYPGTTHCILTICATSPLSFKQSVTSFEQSVASLARIPIHLPAWWRRNSSIYGKPVGTVIETEFMNAKGRSSLDDLWLGNMPGFLSETFLCTWEAEAPY